MKNILRALLFGVMAGIGLGIYFSERGRQRQEQEEAAMLANDPEGIELLALSNRFKQEDKWINNIEEDLGNA